MSEDRGDSAEAYDAARPASAQDGTPYAGEPHASLPETIGPAVEALPGLARIAAAAAWHTTGWGVRAGAGAGRRVARAVTDPDEAASLAHDAGEAAAVLRDLTRSVSSGVPLARALRTMSDALEGADRQPVVDEDDAGLDPPALPGPGTSRNGTSRNGTSRNGTSRNGTSRNGTSRNGARHPERGTGREPDPNRDLRRLGAELLERSRDVWSEDTGHPAYERILGELAPDEARILLLLLRDGPQPSVDVRTGGPIGMVSSQLVAPGLTMIGARAGCRWPDHVPAYLNNLFRLGLVWFSREALRDPMDYQVLEAQPDVLDAVHSVRFAKVVRRSIHLTPFGEDFCRTCLVEEGTDGTAYPVHAKPPSGEAAEPPSQQ